MRKSSKLFVGMDVHKQSIDVATGEESGGEVRHYGAIGGDLAAVSRLARKIESSARRLVFVYEAGPCGFGIYRLLRGRGHECWVVSPGMTPRSNADRVKTDRRDALKLCRLARAGELTPIHVPDAQDEAMRDLVRAREDAVIMQRQVRQRLGALLLRNDVRYDGKTPWTAAHRRWIAELKLPHGAQHIAFEEYVQAVDEAGRRIERLEAAIREELSQWRWRPVVEALQAFRGIRAIHAVRLVAELGDLMRFASARHLMGYAGTRALGELESAGARARLPRPATLRRAVRWSRPPGPTATARASRWASHVASPGSPHRSPSSPGARSCDCARAFGASVLADCTATRSSSPSRASSPDSSGHSANRSGPPEPTGNAGKSKGGSFPKPSPTTR